MSICESPGYKLMRPRTKIWMGTYSDLGVLQPIYEKSITAFKNGQTQPTLVYNSEGQAVVNLEIRGSYCGPSIESEALPLKAWVVEQVERYAKENFNSPVNATIFKNQEQIAIYPTGAGLILHADDYAKSNKGFVENFQRVITVLVYLNEDFDGGEIEFPKHELKIKPKTGLTLVFPSNGEFKHLVHPITSGVRISLMMTYNFSNVIKKT